MSFMDSVNKAVKNIETSVSELTVRHVKLEERVDNHVKSRFTHNLYFVLIAIMVGIISGLLGYIWGKEEIKNERVQESIERTHSGS